MILTLIGREPETGIFHGDDGHEAEDWNYAQPAFKTPGAVDRLFVAQDLSPAPWNVHFNLDRRRTGTGKLTIGVAGANFAGLEVTLNGTRIADFASIPPQPSDFAFYRAGVAGYYRKLAVRFDAALLKPGENTLTLLVKRTVAGGDTLYAAVMYDGLQMEVDIDVPFVPELVFSGVPQATRNVQGDGSSMMRTIPVPEAVDWALWKGLGAPAQRHANGNVIGELRAIGSPGAASAWNFVTYAWGANGVPDESSAGFSAGLSSGEGVNPGVGYAVDITLPAETGTLTFWGVTRINENKLTIEDADGVPVFTGTYRNSEQQWDVTTFTIQWQGAVPNTTVTLKWVSDATFSAVRRVGLAGLMVESDWTWRTFDEWRSVHFSAIERVLVLDNRYEYALCFSGAFRGRP